MSAFFKDMGLGPQRPQRTQSSQRTRPIPERTTTGPGIVNSQVELYGLENMKDLNGKPGKIIAQAGTRYVVEINGNS